MAAKKDDVTTYTKAELIKALRASVAREAKLQKRVAALEGDIARRQRTTYGEPAPDAQFIADVDEGARLALHGELTPEPAAEDQAPPAFPWDVK